MIRVRPRVIDSDAGEMGIAPPDSRTLTLKGAPGAPLSSGKQTRKSPCVFERVNGVPGGGTGALPSHISTSRSATGCAVGLSIWPAHGGLAVGRAHRYGWP